MYCCSLPSGAKLGMWLFLISDFITFATLLVAYGLLRSSAPAWPHPLALIPGTVMTALLLASSWTMAKAVQTASRKWIFLTAGLGAGFLALHAMEWSRLAHESFAEPLFGATFFTITGFHMMHVAVGVIYLTAIALRRSTQLQLEVSALYWQFVDLVWIVIFPAIYLTSMGGQS